MPLCVTETRLPVRDYDLAATLTSGQVFRWRRLGDGWEGVVRNRWVRLEAHPDHITALAAGPVPGWQWLTDFLRAGEELGPIVASFPDDAPMRAAVRECQGLRLLGQEPWECLASFICSATKQIVQIQQILALVTERFGDPLPVPPGHPPAYAFPAPERLAGCSETELRDCKMGFRAPHLRATARLIAAGEVDLAGLGRLPVERARAALLRLPGVGRKIADCVLLFACGCATAFPLDVWLLRALRQLYFSGRPVGVARLRHFSETHFGPHAGYAQQYLFHYVRLHQRRARSR